jgi:hypothetical protein
MIYVGINILSSILQISYGYICGLEAIYTSMAHFKVKKRQITFAIGTTKHELMKFQTYYQKFEKSIIKHSIIHLKGKW